MTDPIRPILMPPLVREPSWVCAWQKPKCGEESTHWHHAYGELCPTHAVAVIQTGEPVKRLK